MDPSSSKHISPLVPPKKKKNSLESRQQWYRDRWRQWHMTTVGSWQLNHNNGIAATMISLLGWGKTQTNFCRRHIRERNDDGTNVQIAGCNRPKRSRVFRPESPTRTARCGAQAWAGQVAPERDAGPHDGGAGWQMWVQGGKLTSKIVAVNTG
jgi:hypothetical protein